MLSIFFSSLLILSISISSLLRIIFLSNQTSIPIIISLSSINHLSWIRFSFFNLNQIWLIYLIFYSLIISRLIIYFHFINLSSSLQIKNLSFTDYFFIISLIISLGGIPPLLGFLLKWIIIINTKLIYLPLIIILIFSSTIRIFFYIRIFFPLLMNFSQENKSLFSSINITLISINFLSLFIFPQIIFF